MFVERIDEEKVSVYPFISTAINLLVLFEFIFPDLCCLSGNADVEQSLLFWLFNY